MSDDAHRTAQTAPGYSSASDLQPGSTVGEYRIEGVAGRGGMGVVYAAVQPVIEKKVAIKVLNAQLSADHDLVRRFVDEARAVNRIGHENIIDIFSFGQLPDGRQYFVMEYLEGATLGARLDRGDLQTMDVPFILAQICEALEAAHAKKIVHRDLKPENVWIATSNRGRPKVRLLDFGIAKLLETGERTITDVGAIMGTPHYMSPEQCNGRGVDHRTDIYALGVLLYRLFAGRLPIQGQTYAEILAKQIVETPPPPSTYAPVPPALDKLIGACLQKDPTARPQSAAELGAALGQIFGVANMIGSGPVSAAHKGNAGLPTMPASAGGAMTDVASAATVTPAPPSGGSTGATMSPGAAPARRSKLVPVVLALAAAAILGGAWLALRSSSGARPATVAPSAPVETADRPVVAAPPAQPTPTPAAAPELAAPAPVEKPSVDPNARPVRSTRKRDVTATPPTTPPKKAHDRASDTGLVTDNPFQ
ncbi:MAG TPA: serine/threonine-protein kinase [Polyangia bacterium]|jgi:serine/threonine-protein kinase